MRRIPLKPNTNTLELWDAHYAHSAELCRLVIYKRLIKYIWDSQMRVLDIGCGSGIGIHHVKKIFPSLDCYGCDFSGKAIDVAKSNYPEITFFNHDINTDELNRKYDLIIIAETLEHIEEPYKAIDKYLKYCRKLLLSLPYNETEKNDKEHLFCEINLDSFPDYVIDDFDTDKNYFRILISGKK